MDVTQSPVTAAASTDGQGCCVTVCVLRVAGALTARTAACVRTGGPALLRTAPVPVRPDTEAPTVGECVRRACMGLAVVAPVRSVFTLMARVTTSLDSVTVYPAFTAPSATRCVPVGGSGRPVLRPAPVLTMGPVTPSMAPVSAIQAGSGTTAQNRVLEDRGVQTVSTNVTVTTELSATQWTGCVTVGLGGPGYTVHNAVRLVSSALTVLKFVVVKMARTVTTSVEPAPVEPASLDTTVNSSARRVRLDMGANSCVNV